MQNSSYDYALLLLSRTPKTVKMMQTTLLAKSYSFEEVEQTINRLKEQNYLNDEAFCEAYIRSEIINKGKSTNLIRKKLFEKGMPSDIVVSTLQNMSKEIEEVALKNLARDITKIHSQGHDMIKIYEKLVRKGHQYDDIKAALQYIESQRK